MSDLARIDSIDALKTLRASLCTFAESVQVALAEAESEIRRVMIWLQQEQLPYWKSEVRKHGELVQRAKTELIRKQYLKIRLEDSRSNVDEKKALAKAQAKLETANEKLDNCKRWIRKLEQEGYAYTAIVQSLSLSVEHDLPNAWTHLDNMIDSLQAYVSAEPPSEDPSASAEEQT